MIFASNYLLSDAKNGHKWQELTRKPAQAGTHWHIIESSILSHSTLTNTSSHCFNTKDIRHSKSITFQMAEVAIKKKLFAQDIVLDWIIAMLICVISHFLIWIDVYLSLIGEFRCKYNIIQKDKAIYALKYTCIKVLRGLLFILKQDCIEM